MKTLKEYELLIDEFKHHYPNLADEIVEWFPIGKKEISIRLKSGKLVSYTLYGNTIGKIDERDPYEECDETENEWRESFSKRLDRIMRIRAFTVERLSDETDISHVTLYKYLKGTSTPSTYNIKKIAQAMDISILELI